MFDYTINNNNNNNNNNLLITIPNLQRSGLNINYCKAYIYIYIYIFYLTYKTCPSNTENNNLILFYNSRNPLKLYISYDENIQAYNEMFYLYMANCLNFINTAIKMLD